VKINIGTSGWNYKHWRGWFYPEDLPQKQWLNFYIKKFKTVELNNSFYRLPTKEVFQKWKASVPGDFIFSVKGSRYLTHMKKLNDPEDSLKDFIANVKGLGNKSGPVLFQLPPGWALNIERFTAFLKALPKKFKFTFEFRNSSWWNDEVYSLLKKYNAAFCIFELGGVLSPKEVTADFIYIRLHGPGGKYQGDYSSTVLSGWSDFFKSCRNQAEEIFCYFDNDQNAYAAKNALELIQIVKKGVI
jgi:uncharacterized protein YecE (DUF72 family)